MTRNILLPSSGNIFMDSYQWKIIKKNLYDYFDNLIIFLNTPNLNESLIEDYKKIFDDKKVIFLPPENNLTTHIVAMEKLAANSDADVSCFFESDFFIYDKTIFDDSFKKIESNAVDYIGEPRGFCTGELLEEFRRQYSSMKYIYDDFSVWNWPSIEKWPGNLLWYAWWPCGFYAKKDIIKNKDYYNCPQIIKRGEIVHHLKNYKCNEDNCSDTFGCAGLMLHHNKFKFDIVDLDQFDSTSGSTAKSLLHLLEESHIKSVRYRSQHICNSSVQLNTCGLNDQPYNAYTIPFDDINVTKNIIMFNTFLEIYDRKNTEFYIKIRKKWEIYLSHLKEVYINDNYKFRKVDGSEYIFTYDHLMHLSELYKNNFLSYM